MKGLVFGLLAGLGWLLLEVAAQILIEVCAALGFIAVRGAPSRDPIHPALLIPAWGIVGLVAGIITLLVQPERFTPPARILGVSLVFAPLLTGGATHSLGLRWREGGGDPPPQAFTFSAGAGFAFGVALVRFSYLVVRWPVG